MKQIRIYTYQTEGKILSAAYVLFLLIIVPNMLKSIWPSLLMLASKMGQTNVCMFVMVSVGANLVALVLNNLFMLYVYWVKSPFFQQFRISPQVPWPWEKDADWHKKLTRTILLVMLNGVVINIGLTLGQSYIHNIQYTYTLQSWPNHLQTVTQFVIFFLYNQVVSYYAHWVFHSALLYPIHKKHHEYTTTISLTATYAHPLQYMFSNLLSTALCIPLLSLLTDVHLASIVPWVLFRLTQTIEVHSGYEFPWGCLTFLPWKNRAAFHDFHHSHNSGTYGSMLSWMDRLMGTDKQYNKYYKLE